VQSLRLAVATWSVQGCKAGNRFHISEKQHGDHRFDCDLNAGSEHTQETSVPDPHVFGHPGSGSISQIYRSRSFDHYAKIVRKTYWFVTFLDFLSLKNDVNVPSKIKKQKTFFLKSFVCAMRLEGQ
jgi:hypothetical protein